VARDVIEESPAFVSEQEGTEDREGSDHLRAQPPAHDGSREEYQDRPQGEAAGRLVEGPQDR